MLVSISSEVSLDEREDTDCEPLSYTRIDLEKIAAIRLDSKEFGLHSLRSDGASPAANAGVPDRWFRRHGRWLSENAKDCYVKDTLEDHLSVSKNIGLQMY